MLISSNNSYTHLLHETFTRPHPIETRLLRIVIAISVFTLDTNVKLRSHRSNNEQLSVVYRRQMPLSVLKKYRTIDNISCTVD